MAVKSVIKIDVDDKQFHDFLEHFEKYKKALEKMPGAWAAADDAIGTTSEAFVGMTAAVLAQQELLHKTAKTQEKMRDEVKKTDNAMVSLGRSSAKVFENIKGITFSLLKWSTVTSAISALMGFGGLFGYEQLARGAANTRTQSLGLGISPQEYTAANTAYARIGGAGDLLSKIAGIRRNASQQYLLTQRLGIPSTDIANKDNAQLLPEVLAAIRQKYNAIPMNQRDMLAGPLGLTEFMDAGSLARLGATAPSELNAMGIASKAKVPGSDKTSEEYQDFLMKLGESWNKFTGTMQVSLLRLKGPINDVVTGFNDLVVNILDSAAFKEGLHIFANWIEGLGEWMSRHNTKQDVDDFLGALEKGGQVIGQFVTWLGSFFPSSNASPATPDAHLNKVPLSDAPGGQAWQTWKGSPPPGLLGAVQKVENATGDPNAIGYNSWGWPTAAGKDQISYETARAYGVNNRNPVQSDMFAAWYLNMLATHYGYDPSQTKGNHMSMGNLEAIKKAAAAYEGGPGTVDMAVNGGRIMHGPKIAGHGADWLNYVNPAARNEVNKVIAGLKITIVNSTGNNTTAIVGAAASGVP